MSAKADVEIRMRDQLRTEQSQWLSLWRDCAAFCCPHKQTAVQNAYAQAGVNRPRFNPIRQSSVAIDSLNVLSGGCKSWLIPGGDEGLGAVWEPDESMDPPPSAALKDWYAECTQRAAPHADRGGYFTAGHEMFQDLGWAGTAGMMIDDGTDGNVMFCQSHTPTNFLIQRDAEDNVIRAMITWSRSATLIKDQFNMPGDTVPERIKTDCTSNNGNQTHELLQTLYMRSDAERGEEREYEPKGQAVASCWIHVDSQTIMRERGYPEMPFIAPRWNTWAGTMTSAYGTSPAMQAIADIKGLNLLDMIMAVRAELEINPRVKVMPSQSGTIDLSPQGITQMAEKDGVSEWAPLGKFTVAQVQAEVVTRRIERAFFKDLFESITPIAQQREMNMMVAEAVMREAAGRISPAMSRVKQDFFESAMMRIFMMCFRGGIFSPPPREAFHELRTGRFHLILPQVTMANRMSRTMNAKRGYAFQQMMSRRQIQVAMGHPEVMDDVNFEAVNADLDRGDGAPASWKFTPEQVAKMRAERAKVAQESAIQQTMLDAAGNHPLDVAKIATGNIAA